jgi:uncharacterized protein
VETGGESFSNLQVTPGDLPDYSRITLDPVARAYLPYALTGNAGFWLLLGGLSLAAGHVPWVSWFGQPWLTAGLFALILPALFFAWLDARHRAWGMREHDLIYQSGVLWRKTVVLPFSRIQHVETASGPIERLFGLMRLQCFTAGGMSADLVVVGLRAEQALRVRSHLLDRIRTHDRAASN